MATTVRTFPLCHASGPWLMAADELMLEQAIERGTPSLRFYHWTQATASLGYFQSVAEFQRSPFSRLPLVRRSTGGETLVHDCELTYAFAIPSELPWQTRGLSWIARMHHIIRQALLRFDVQTELCEREERRADLLCFHHHTPCDLLLQGNKIVGSAQRKRRGALLQHGGILKRQSHHTPNLSGIQDLTGKDIDNEDLSQAIEEEWTTSLECKLELRPWEASELSQIDEKVTTRYGDPAWTLKR